jgi:murein peptide amidase A
VSNEGRGAIDATLVALRSLVELNYKPLGHFTHNGAGYSLPRFTFRGPNSSDPIRIGIFAGIHGDEPAGALALVEFLRALATAPAMAADYLIHAYPLCNPSGFERGTRVSASGVDLNREFWKSSEQPEVQIIERELREEHFQGLIQLHADDTSDGIYGFVRGHTLSENLLKPALAEAAKILPRNINAQIDGFAAKDGIIYDAYEGILAAPPQIEPVPFELILETPHHAPLEKQTDALVAAMRTVLDEYRRLIAFAANL